LDGAIDVEKGGRIPRGIAAFDRSAKAVKGGATVQDGVRKFAEVRQMQLTLDDRILDKERGIGVEPRNGRRIVAGIGFRAVDTVRSVFDVKEYEKRKAEHWLDDQLFSDFGSSDLTARIGMIRPK
jgi:hypothetical protein